MEHENFIKNITSKDIKLSHSTIENILKTSNIEAFGQLTIPSVREKMIAELKVADKLWHRGGGASKVIADQVMESI